jgi:hypothetical protein
VHYKKSVLLSLALALALIAFTIPAAHISAGSAVVCENIHTTDLATWTLTETRSEGHNELVDGGLRVWTDSNSSQAKAAGYYTLMTPLSSISSAEMIYTTTLGTIPPSLQIRFYADDSGTLRFGTLVGEASFYGANWWLTNGSAQFLKDNAPNTGDGNGSKWFGTLSEWIAAFPNAQVWSIGYSLGSGVLGDYVIESMTYGCNVFTFGLPGMPPPPAAIPPSAGFTCLVMIDAPVSPPFYAQWLNGRVWMNWDGFLVQDFDKAGGIELSLHTHDGESSGYQYYRVLGNNGTEIRFFERIQGGRCIEISDPLAED